MSIELPAPRPCAVATAVAIALGPIAAGAQGIIEEIVVTATKREESMQDVPVAMTALQGDSLDELRIGSFQDYVQFLPNVVAQGTGPGQNEIFIRGAATSQTVLTLSSVQGLQPSVALYLDEQPVAMQGRNLDVYATDLSRIEVLPGPQGTLFGASSQAGTVRLITNKPDHSEVQAGFDVSFSTTSGGEESNSIEAYLNVPVTENFALRVAAYNDNQGGWIDNVLNDPANGGWNGSATVVDRISGGPLADPANTTMPLPRNDQFVENNFNDATYSGVRAGASILINDDWELLLQHTHQSLDTEGVWAYDANLASDSSVNRFAPDNNEDDFGLTTWTLSGRLAMLDVVYTGGFLKREVNSTVDYTWYTNGGLFSAYYVCYGNPAGTYNECFDPQKFYKEDTENERTTHEFRLNTPTDNPWRVTAGVFYDDQELASTGLFKIASTADPTFGNLARTLVGGGGTPGTRTDGGPFPSEISFVNDVTRTTEQVAVFGQVEFDISDAFTVAVGARWYDIDDDYKGATTTVNVTNQLAALGDGSLSALQGHFGAAEGQAIFDAIQGGQLDVSELNGNGVLNQSDTIIRVSLDWRVSDEVLLFGTYAQGFRPPVTNRVGASLANVQSGPFTGFRVPVSSATDDLDNYEIGVKTDLLGNTLRLNATAYWSEISDLQTSRFDPTNISFLWFADNVGDAEITGIDTDFVWAATDNLMVSGAFSWLDSEITRLNDELVGIAAPVGSDLPFAADFSWNLRARYDFDVMPIGELNGLAGYLTAVIAYTGESVAGVKMDAFVAEDTLQRVYQVAGSGLAIRREADAFLGAALGTDLINEPDVPGGRFVQGDYTIANVAFGVTMDEWSAELFIDNIADESGEVYVDTQNFTPKVVTNRPRTIGIRLSYDF